MTNKHKLKCKNTTVKIAKSLLAISLFDTRVNYPREQWEQCCYKEGELKIIKGFYLERDIRKKIE